MCYFLNGVAVMKDTLRVKEADRELSVLPRRAHRDGDRFAHQGSSPPKTEDNFEWFLHGEVIDIVRRFLRVNMPADAKIADTEGIHGITSAL
jgi:hypothetical protein